MSDNTNPERHDPPGSPGARTDAAKKDLTRAGEEVKHEAARTASELREQGSEIASSVMEGADRYAREQKDAGAQHVASVARAVERAADELEETSPELARHVHDAATSVERFSDRIRQGNVRDLIHDANDFARREPALFFGAAVIAGMALSRFLRSSAAHETGQSGGSYHSGDGRSASATTTRRPT
ncbi:hypothetical protein [Pararhodobacter sp. SW119]|uniref:hypothetical protein n=1 Tax=Pararhodobacter sp. SW119 TaxID=2780075 RepID=UPI001AE02335|nr:hypothetical protein [Pararhodobacter sp. SW119]